MTEVWPGLNWNIEPKDLKVEEWIRTWSVERHFPFPTRYKCLVKEFFFVCLSAQDALVRGNGRTVEVTFFYLQEMEVTVQDIILTSWKSIPVCWDKSYFQVRKEFDENKKILKKHFAYI